MNYFRDLKKTISSDLYRYYGKTDRSTFLKTYFRIPGFKYTFWFRLASYYKKRNVFIFFLCNSMLRHYSYKFGIQIPYGTKIGAGFYIGHFSCIVVSPGCEIGKNVNISQGVTIGRTNRGNKAGAPIIGDHIYIGPGAKIIGNIKIENNVCVGANAVVTKDVPTGSVVAGIPARVLSMDGSEGYVNNKI